MVVGTLKTLKCKWSGRSADYIAPSLANGCFGACAYCYVDRHKAINPISLFTNVEEIFEHVDEHAMSLPWPKTSSQTDDVYYTYDIGCNSDVSVDATLSDSIQYAIRFFRDHPRAKGTFATKFVNKDLLQYDPQGKTRIRFSLMPAYASKRVDVRTDPIEKRIQAIEDFWRAGYEVHLNFSPIIVYGGKQWRNDYQKLFEQLDRKLSPKVKDQMQCEVIFLTHNRIQHETNLGINPKAEALIWTPELQEDKRSQMGGYNIRYKHQMKSRMIDIFEQIHAETIPWCNIRYIF
ncbi:spore photoproduct lyase [Catalinimonas alkaloidigena]|nr:spore photoproduct lyase [Catalinimonas alkaloidigena]